ncbi:FHA domain-containing protein [Amycolatopsis nalaikhensis]|uniref:FHA domain-containing protein n=1 Tax=Amycolatopsis nalaikhensis TaxID=715472 RepID=A0ABY8XIA8_9PSEU|nr:FHA domain-containing protein [Amycolatopsis sp. 2-2]WIV55331.1 FHA domain-containing protein [Amycolatopsis sp. 2-2]
MGNRDAATIETVEGAVARLAVRRGSWLVGRGPEAHLKLYSDHVSPRHAWLRRDARGTWVSDAGSRTGTRVNGEPLAPGLARLLRDGDRVTFGTITTVYADSRPAADEPPVFAKTGTGKGIRRLGVLLGPPLIVAGFGLGVSRVLHFLTAGAPGDFRLGAVLFALGLAITVLSRPQ